MFSSTFFVQRFCSAAPTNNQEFLAEKQEITLLASERARSPAFDYQKLLKAAENRIHSLHENYRLHHSTPPTNMDGDVQEIAGVVQRIHAKRSRGIDVPSDAAAQDIISQIWDQYAAKVDKIYQAILIAKRNNAAESQVYWEAMASFGRLRDETEAMVIFNPPEGADTDDAVYTKDELKLLKALEFTDRRTKGDRLRVELITPKPAKGILDIAPFYASQGILPEKTPREIATLTVPAGSRTVTRRRSGENLIVRTIEGKGVAYIGTAEKLLNYGYIFIPADTAYYFENTSGAPLELEYIALGAS